MFDEWKREGKPDKLEVYTLKQIISAVNEQNIWGFDSLILKSLKNQNKDC